MRVQSTYICSSLVGIHNYIQTTTFGSCFILLSETDCVHLFHVKINTIYKRKKHCLVLFNLLVTPFLWIDVNLSNKGLVHKTERDDSSFGKRGC